MFSRSRSGGLKEQRPQMPDEKSPFVIKCISEECTVVHAGMQRFSVGQLDDEIKSGSEFGKKLAEAKREVMELRL